jgi:hypothetical protein
VTVDKLAIANEVNAGKGDITISKSEHKHNFYTIRD